MPNGESIFLSPGMSLVLETDDLSHATPATITRCGLLHMQGHVKPKQLINKWLRNLPGNIIQDKGALDIENYCNMLFSIGL